MAHLGTRLEIGPGTSIDCLTELRKVPRPFDYILTVFAALDTALCGSDLVLESCYNGKSSMMAGLLV